MVFVVCWENFFQQTYLLNFLRHAPQAPFIPPQNTVYTGWHKKWELLINPTKIEEIQKKKKLTEIEPLQLAF